MNRLKNLIIVFLVISLLPMSVFALSLDEAKAKGLVGEETSGYLGAVETSAEVSELVADINSKRRQKYQEIASKNGTSLSSVEILAGKKAIENTPSGQFVKLPGATWSKK